MAFHRALGRLLALRQSLERQEEMRLAVITGRLERARTALEAARHQRQELSAGTLTRAGSARGAELQAAALQQLSLEDYLARLQHELEELLQAHQIQCRRLAERQQARKILETLRDRHQSAERRDERRRDQARLDELFLLRH